MLLYPEAVDKLLNWPLGRAQRLARRRKLPHVILPDGSIRFDPSEVDGFLVRVPAKVDNTSNGKGADHAS